MGKKKKEHTNRRRKGVLKLSGKGREASDSIRVPWG